MGKNLGILEEIIKAQPTDGLWDDGRTDVSSVRYDLSRIRKSHEGSKQ